MKLNNLITLLVLCSFASLNAQDLKIYVSDAEDFTANSGKILQYDIDGTNPVVFIDEELSWPQDIVFLSDRNEVIISNLNSGGRITRYNATTGNYIDDFAVVTGGPTRMEIGPDGLLYVLQWSNTDNNVLRFELDGTFIDEFTDVGVPRSIGMDWDNAGRLYVSSFSQGNVTQFDTNGISLGEFVDSAELSGPTNIFFDNDGNLFVCDWNDGDVEQYNNTGTHTGTFITGLGQVEGVDFLDSGNILLGNGSTAEVKQYLSDGMFVENTVTSGLGGLEQPNAVVIFDRATLGITENSETIKRLVTPSMGTTFTLLDHVSARFERVNIYNAVGHHIETLSSQKKIWNASKYAEGLYFVVANDKQNSVTQKVIIAK